MKKSEQWSRFDATDGLTTEADMVAYLQAALEDGDPALLTAAFDDVERARAKLRTDALPNYTLEELLAQCQNLNNLNAINKGLKSELTPPYET
ncbi:DNA-binding protein [Aeromonas allosaccharophila]|uniref:Transcriptional regulator n=1 Tax=Aeromonas allosaccharophila TaxID=656 RepID=A0AAX3NZF1_9GAMM|nr:hypothetical protein [Aeromonas allosaccharophila]WED78762.1 hypothetical protein PYU98_11380 [Aeromonas allosaccharophila]